ncbi:MULTISPECIES: cob(I)yrinic acid a,c-diamide adenosyltransferase [Acinetobacter]|jgi:cob(I)alamin adenosyltransferase|uniref:Corrinoid adenosyltransferase n=2 Tax=Acinetobacter schindleri TaxID=108981 RepID=N8XYX2_9GAMM|nr:MULTISPECIES: cob(I)yrinic acid a,c-diamide adenosyltransferase [Acinetobacter]ENV12563.1 ATP:cob(I)alamin adenosyltransferase [Acinetobacter schindleri NIPH 900]MBB4836573.1 cob(I)alamin adenosyltransferase [Acinetobacter schindleri]MCO8068518.1 cob(I)yrinic acid a,c-diamide adenosyltransferase [Acinetobacter schindleri]MDP1445896.1 cob(I)yrinic acid a,c-diamide adenosyltransferase [Acinetobacter schindleri]QIC61698.1 cob(I)yrinic acid a,c-diamide adenosyltransferase [Acinetobacter schindl
MGHRLSKIYTRTGDSGTTGLGDGSRVAKDDLRITALGDVDELNATIGVLRSQISISPIEDKATWDKSLSLIQHWLFDLGGEVCIPGFNLVQPVSIDFLENDIDRMNEALPMLKDFILPAGSLSCSYAHQARAVCRRAERSVMSVHSRDQNIQATSLQLLNRLSDWLFVASRTLQRAEGGSEVLWQKNINETIDQ